MPKTHTKKGSDRGRRKFPTTGVGASPSPRRAFIAEIQGDPKGMGPGIWVGMSRSKVKALHL